ncbi:MAG: head GIN domain-containing protein [Caldilineaceae bacterium]
MKPSRYSMIAILLLTVGLLSGCSFVRGSGHVISEMRNVSNFDRIDLSGSGDVIITQGEEESLTVETDDNLMPHIVTTVSGGTLHLGQRNEPFNILDPTQLTFRVQVKDLTGVDISGSGSVSAGAITTDRLALDISGSGTIKLEQLTADQVTATISGSGSAQMAGTAPQSTIEISGSGATRFGDLRSDQIDINVSGSGTATVWAMETLDVHLSGSGSVSYYGNPTVNSSASGSGTVRSLGAK